MRSRGCLLVVISALFCIAFLAAPSAHAVISDGAAAIDLLGQYEDPTVDAEDLVPVYTKGLANDGPNRLGFVFSSTALHDLVFDAVDRKLFVADGSNGRVLVYTLTSTGALADRIPDNVLGQANFYSRAAANTQDGLGGVTGLAYDNVRDLLFVGDFTYDRVMVYDLSDGVSNGENALAVLGQPDFTTSGELNTQAGMNDPIGLAYEPTSQRLFVSQSGNHRVTVYDVSTITNGEDAVSVLGQSDFTSFAAANTQAGMKSPQGLALSGSTTLFVAQGGSSTTTGTNRVTLYDITSISDGEDAVNVLGQTTFTGASPAATQAGMYSPRGVTYDPTNQRLFVSQSISSGTPNRVTVYDLEDGISDGESAVSVLGQSTFTASAAANTQAGMKVPMGITYDEGNQRLFVANNGNHRITIYDVASISDGEDAVDLLGQYGDDLSNPQPVYTKIDASNGPNRLGFSMSATPLAVSPLIDSTNHRLFVPDYSNNRVLVFNLDTDDTLVDRVPDNVLGQPSFSSGSALNTQSLLRGPQGLAYDADGDRLFVASAFGNRVLVYDVSSITDGEDATYVLGQADFTSTAAAGTQAGMSSPRGMAYDETNQRLFVSESGNHRVTVYDVSSITNGEDAVYVLGQADFTSTAAANTQAGMNSPYGVSYAESNKRLFVVQSTANRVTVYDISDGITNGESAVNVLGQPDFTTVSAVSTQAGMSGPRAVAYDETNQRLFVAQASYHRVTVYDVASITDGENAVNVLGQSDFTSTAAAAAQTGLSTPQGIAFDPTNARLYVANGSRISIFDVAVASGGSSSNSSSSSSSTATVTTSGGGGGGGNGGRRGSEEAMQRRIEEAHAAVMTRHQGAQSARRAREDGVQPDAVAREDEYPAILLLRSTVARLRQRIETRIVMHPGATPLLRSVLERLEERLQNRIHALRS